MGDLLAVVLPLAFGAAVSPVTLLAMLAVLSGPRPISRGAACAAGAVTVTAAELGGGLLMIDATDYTEDETSGPLGSPVASTVLGLVLVVYAGYLMLHRSSNAGPVLSRAAWRTRQPRLPASTPREWS